GGGECGRSQCQQRAGDEELADHGDNLSWWKHWKQATAGGKTMSVTAVVGAYVGAKAAISRSAAQPRGRGRATVLRLGSARGRRLDLPQAGAMRSAAAVASGASTKASASPAAR